MSAPPLPSTLSSTQAPTPPSRAHQFYGGIAFGNDASEFHLAQNWLVSRQQSKGGRGRLRGHPPSKFVEEKRRKLNHGAFSCFESVVEKVESVIGDWHCVYCDLIVQIDNRLNQVCCPQCQARHLEAPRRPVQGVVRAR